MPYEVRWELHGVYSRYYGNVTGDDMRRHIEEVCKDERFDRHRYNILDFSDATDFSPTERELLINSGVLIAAAFTNHQVLIAAVVTRPERQGSPGAIPCTWRVALRREDISDGSGSEEMDSGVRFHGGTLQRRLIVQARLHKPLISKNKYRDNGRDERI